MPTNIFDQPQFFEGYQKIRKKVGNYNDTIEQPAMRELTPPLEGKLCLDLGCGAGQNCMDFAQRGAARVLGLDLSEKMLKQAKRENNHPGIEYQNLPMESLDEIDETFDFIYSSLAFHYIENFGKLLKDIHRLLSPGGILLFSQEHPMGTAPLLGPSWITEEGEKKAALVSDYLDTGRRNIHWMVDGVIKYHRSCSEILNALIQHGFTIIKLVEPKPSREVLERFPWYTDEIHRPTSLIIKAKK